MFAEQRLTFIIEKTWKYNFESQNQSNWLIFFEVTNNKRIHMITA